MRRVSTKMHLFYSVLLRHTWQSYNIKCTTWWFDKHTVNGFHDWVSYLIITSHIYLNIYLFTYSFKFYTVSKFQLYNIALSATITMLSTSDPKISSLYNRVCILFVYSYQSLSSPPNSWRHNSTLYFEVLNFFFFRFHIKMTPWVFGLSLSVLFHLA